MRNLDLNQRTSVWKTLFESPVANTIGAIITFILGYLLSQIAPITQANELNIIAIISIFAISLITIACAVLIWKGLQSIEKNVSQTLEEAINQRARLSDYHVAYPEIANILLNYNDDGKSHTIRILTYYTYDWGNQQRGGDKNVHLSEERAMLFKALNKVIHNPQFTFHRLIQTPRELTSDNIIEAIREDVHYLEEAKVLHPYSMNAAQDRAWLRFTTRIFTESTFILIDDKHLYLNIGIKDPQILPKAAVNPGQMSNETLMNERDLVFLIHDGTEKRFSELITLFDGISRDTKVVPFPATLQPKSYPQVNIP